MGWALADREMVRVFREAFKPCMYCGKYIKADDWFWYKVEGLKVAHAACKWNDTEDKRKESESNGIEAKRN